jgi:ParB family transcriptional regulator, chromosome partitioning protein
MQLEMHQLERRWEHLRLHEPHRQRQLMASLAEGGQQSPIIVVPAENDSGRYVVIDGYKRIAALEQLRRDTVEAIVWEISEAEALLLERSLRLSRQECALEQGWLLSEMAQSFGYSVQQLARRFDRSISWVSRRLALVELVPQTIQQQVREGRIAAQTAMKYLVPMARRSAQDCERMAAVFARLRCDTRQAAQLYRAWREGSHLVRERILSQPELFLRTQQQRTTAGATQAAMLQRELETVATILCRAGQRIAEAAMEMNDEERQQVLRHIESARGQLERIGERIGEEDAEPVAENHDCGTERERSIDTRDCARAEGLAAERAQGAALELRRCPGDSPGRESRTIPGADPRAFPQLQGESRASP